MAIEGARPLRILFLGASYGVVLGMRAAAAGHQITFACRQQEADLINEGKLLLRIPAKDHALTVEISPSQCAVAPAAFTPDEIDPQPFDLVCLAMQEPQYSAAGIRSLVGRIAAARTPCLSIMNMPLPPFLDKFGAMDEQSADSIFTEAELWASFDPAAFTMASADPQSMRVDSDNMLITGVTLATNFKVAPFGNSQQQDMLEQLARDIDRSRIDMYGTSCTPRVRLCPHPSRLVPLAKWPMLITGNFRCMTGGDPRSIGEAVCRSESESRELYDWVLQVCSAVGVEDSTLVPFDRYLAAAAGLSLPSSLARGLHAGATAVERVDILIQTLAASHHMAHPALDRIVADVNARLERNRALK
jgi:hypothetical protein